ncbi:hypothetical protein C7S16_1289 [Burkholderia thailandensis]|uniref:Uncharacterized protein n=1 Tax=Burkholderia thailandensis TaxID=57975 RepID=A0AAW9D1C5_BURTH|nr:hypothetical protein [Burkholderia thailandensis]
MVLIYPPRRPIGFDAIDYETGNINTIMQIFFLAKINH